MLVVILLILELSSVGIGSLLISARGGGQRWGPVPLVIPLTQESVVFSSALSNNKSLVRTIRLWLLTELVA